MRIRKENQKRRNVIRFNMGWRKSVRRERDDRDRQGDK